MHNAFGIFLFAFLIEWCLKGTTKHLPACVVCFCLIRKNHIIPSIWPNSSWLPACSSGSVRLTLFTIHCFILTAVSLSVSLTTYLVGSQQHLLTILLLFRNCVTGTECKGLKTQSLGRKTVEHKNTPKLAHKLNLVQSKAENLESEPAPQEPRNISINML